MKKFEYTILDVPAKNVFQGGKIDIEELTKKLNDLGSLGWEVVSPGGSKMREGVRRGTYIILKREITH